MTMHELLVQILNKRYENALNDLAFRTNAGSPEQEELAEELEKIDFELFQLTSAPDLNITQDNNWGNDALRIMDRFKPGRWVS